MDKRGQGESLKQGSDLLSDIIKLSLSSYGETEEELEARNARLLELGLSEDLIAETLKFETWLGKTDLVLFTRKISSIVRAGHELFGYEVSDMHGPSDYILTTEELVEKNPGCCGCCVGVVPTLDELSFMLTTKKTGVGLIHVLSTEGLMDKHELSPNFKTCVNIVINAEVKGVVRLDFPPSAEGTYGDITLETVPVAVIGQDGQLVFIFRPSTLEQSGDVTDIITADGTGFVVAKVGPAESLLNESSGFSNASGKVSKNHGTNSTSNTLKRDNFCVLFLDSFLGRSWKQLLFSVSTVFVCPSTSSVLIITHVHYPS